MRCAHCDKTSPDHSVFCIHCGGKFAKAPRATHVRCLHCRRDSPAFALFCVHCGKALRRAKALPLRCPACGERNAGGVFCVRCGQALPDPEVARACARCGQAVSEADAYCPHCGESLCTQPKRIWVCTGCLRILPPGSRHCPHCGAPLPGESPAAQLCSRCGEDCPEDAAYCLRCGEALSPPAFAAKESEATAPPGAVASPSEDDAWSPVCATCRTKNHPRARYCAACGEKLRHAPPTSQSADPATTGATLADLALCTPQYCLVCGEEVPAESSGCPHCGFVLDRGSSPLPPMLTPEESALLSDQLDELLPLQQERTINATPTANVTLPAGLTRRTRARKHESLRH